MTRDVGLLILRISFGILLMFHGFGKVSRIFTGNFGFPDPIGIGSAASLVLAGFSEFFCSLAVVVGFKTRFAAIPVVITMFVAALIYHAGDPMGDKELAFVYAFGFLTLALTDGGKYSLDTLLQRKQNEKTESP